jgi:hypothetical protein
MAMSPVYDVPTIPSKTTCIRNYIRKSTNAHTSTHMASYNSQALISHKIYVSERQIITMFFVYQEIYSFNNGGPVASHASYLAARKSLYFCISVRRAREE